MAETARAHGFASSATESSPKLLKIHVWAPSFEGFGGGIGAFTRELTRGLAARGHDLRLMGKRDSPGKFEDLPLWGPGSSLIPAGSFASGCILAAARDRPDRIVSTHINFAPVAQLIRAALHIPYSLVAHGVDVQPRLSSMTRSAVLGADRIAAVSSWTRRRLTDLGVDESIVAILPNTVDSSRFSVRGRADRLREQYRIIDGERVVLTVARLAASERYKGCDRLIEALPALNEQFGKVRLLIVGSGDDRPRLEAAALALGVPGRVTFAGFVADEDLADHYRMADVFAMPSTGEGFGIVFLEALACGTPVVAGNRDGSVDAVMNGELGQLVDPLDVKAVAEGIAAILSRRGPALWYDREKLHERVIEQFGTGAFRSRLESALGVQS